MRAVFPLCLLASCFLFVLPSSAHAQSVFDQSANCSFFVTASSVEPILRPADIHVGDINQDSRPDIVVTTKVGSDAPGAAIATYLNSIPPFEQSSCGSSIVAADQIELPSANYLRDIKLMPLGGTAADDVVALVGGELHIYETTITGAMDVPEQIELVESAPYPGLRLAPVYFSNDQNDDANVDLGIASFQSGVFSYFFGEPASSDFFADENALNIEATWNANAWDMVSGDFDGNGHVDFAVVVDPNGPLVPELTVMFGNQDGSFTQETFLVESAAPRSMGAGDLNGDGWDEIVLLDPTGDSFEILSYNGTVFYAPLGGVYSIENIPPNSGVHRPSSVKIVDMNLDTYPDIVIGTLASNLILLYLGDANNGVLSTTPEFVQMETDLPEPFYYAGVQALEIADFNSDYSPDVLAVSGVSRSATVFFNQTPAPPSLGVEFRRGDVNDDGIMDLLDAIVLLNYIFPGGNPPPSEYNDCDDAADVDDSGSLSLIDALRILNVLFNPGTEDPPPPYQTKGFDETADTLGCAVYTSP